MSIIKKIIKKHTEFQIAYGVLANNVYLGDEESEQLMDYTKDYCRATMAGHYADNKRPIIDGLTVFRVYSKSHLEVS